VWVAGRELAPLTTQVRLVVRVALGAVSYAAMIRSFFPQAWDEALATVHRARGAAAGVVGVQ